ncbi:hypothetical protein B0H66DRAFT_602718 [Apodospora peruviana]|uniref:Uncharacterized protein n=1 Tax=Apodospora peruviana TaxID=516989 RepID=A0AAE0I468_9PEZI|nr:hypothetical protein B0H66DRAFT_602718 [Apodospora peruviana]
MSPSSDPPTQPPGGQPNLTTTMVPTSEPVVAGTPIWTPIYDINSPYLEEQHAAKAEIQYLMLHRNQEWHTALLPTPDQKAFAIQVVWDTIVSSMQREYCVRHYGLWTCIYTEAEEIMAMQYENMDQEMLRKALAKFDWLKRVMDMIKNPPPLEFDDSYIRNHLDWAGDHTVIHVISMASRYGFMQLDRMLYALLGERDPEWF